MARKDLPWQAEFTEKDRDLIIAWIEKNLSPWDRWGRPLAELGTPARLIIHRGLDESPIICENVDRTLDPKDARRMLRKLGFDKPFIESYLNELRVAGARQSEDAIFANLWLNLAGAGAACHLEEILSSDPENRKRWRKTLKAEGKTWADVQLSDSAKAKVGEAIIFGLARDLKIPEKNTGALRKRFQRYAKHYLRRPVNV